MEIFNLNKFTNGWIVGDFEPSIIKTPSFEVGIKKYKKNEKGKMHFHKIAEEITVVVSGVFKMNEVILKVNDIVKLKPLEKADFECLEDGVVAVVKTPSIIGDKYII